MEAVRLVALAAEDRTIKGRSWFETPESGEPLVRPALELKSIETYSERSGEGFVPRDAP